MANRSSEVLTQAFAMDQSAGYGHDLSDGGKRDTRVDDQCVSMSAQYIDADRELSQVAPCLRTEEDSSQW